MRPGPSLAVGGEQRALVEVVASKKQPLDVPVLDPQLDFEEVALVGDQWIVGLLAERVVRGEPASLNASLLCLKRDRKIAASIGSSKQ